MKLATIALPNIFMFMPESHHLEVNEAKQQKHFRVPVIYWDNRVFPKWGKNFSEFRESDQSLKHELGLI